MGVTGEEGRLHFMRRMLLVLSVAAMMAVMLVAMAAPAFASKLFSREAGSCGQRGVSFEDLSGGFIPFDYFTGPNPAHGQGQGFKAHECPDNTPVG